MNFIMNTALTIATALTASYESNFFLHLAKFNKPDKSDTPPKSEEGQVSISVRLAGRVFFFDGKINLLAPKRINEGRSQNEIHLIPRKKKRQHFIFIGDETTQY